MVLSPTSLDYRPKTLDYIMARRYNALNVQAGTQLCDGAFQKEVATGRLSSRSLGDYSCIALAGVATEYLRFGRSEGGNNDVVQLDAMFKGLQVPPRFSVPSTASLKCSLLCQVSLKLL